MKYFVWKLIGVTGTGWVHHVFPSGTLRVESFISICGVKSGALNGENGKDSYCPICKRLAPDMEAEKALQEKELVRKELQENPKKRVPMKISLKALQESRMKALSESTGVPVSELVDQAIEAYLISKEA